MVSAEATLRDHGMAREWVIPRLAVLQSPTDWHTRVYTAVEIASDQARKARMASMSSTTRYVPLKEWGRNPPPYSFSTGEVARLGR